ncbi:MAG TPA: HIT domain-containing protein [Thermoanaerobaculia bacterium]|jgi:ATP adenylyltransferase|nr:HIT domain-containing protein [Thermoanaerobaculia bacterium]
MDILFTPWRYPYLTAPKNESQSCIFCNAVSSDALRDTLTIFRTDDALVMLNRYPYTNGHLMVAPVAHEALLFQSRDDSLRSLIRLTAESQRILSDVYHPDGFNVGMNFGQVAGAGVADHYHMHIVPRWSGDSNFMTVTARTRIVPEDLDVTYDKLMPHFTKLRKGSITEQ